MDLAFFFKLGVLIGLITAHIQGALWRTLAVLLANNENLRIMMPNFSTILAHRIKEWKQPEQTANPLELEPTYTVDTENLVYLYDIQFEDKFWFSKLDMLEEIANDYDSLTESMTAMCLSPI
ncbi:unnamed protein product [Moneuplotes crassus]|uniref:Uncharacterized protein n=1 Tax=Euplotes crassus TaxID=5936 RepID=A0AAD1UUT7_EUPCR|nr:unnamed protein product [Moneuplotes crassus]